MTKVLLRLAIAILFAEAGFVAHKQLDRRRADVSALLPAPTPDTARSIRIILLLGEDDCRDAVSFVDLLAAIAADNRRISQLVVVAGSPNAVLLARQSLLGRASNVPIIHASFRQIASLGVNPARRLARLLLVDSRGNTLLHTVVPASPKEAAAIVSLSATIAQREVARR